MNKTKAIYYPVRENEVPPFISNAVKQISPLANHYGINEEEIKSLEAYTVNVPLGIDEAEEASNIAQQKTEVKREELHTCKTDFLRMFRFIQDSPKFKEKDAEAIGFRKHHTPPDPQTMKPIISEITVTLEKIIIDWVKSGMEGVFIYGSYDGNTWKKIGRDTRSPYEDERKNQQQQPEERYYKLRYIKNDKPIGFESDVAKVLAEIY
jgi:hypothetical protein